MRTAWKNYNISIQNHLIGTIFDRSKYFSPEQIFKNNNLLNIKKNDSTTDVYYFEKLQGEATGNIMKTRNGSYQGRKSTPIKSVIHIWVIKFFITYMSNSSKEILELKADVKKWVLKSNNIRVKVQ